MSKKEQAQTLLEQIETDSISRMQSTQAVVFLEGLGFKDRTKKHERGNSGGSSRGRFYYLEHPDHEDFGLIKLPRKSMLEGNDFITLASSVANFMKRFPEERNKLAEPAVAEDHGYDGYGVAFG